MKKKIRNLTFSKVWDSCKTSRGTCLIGGWNQGADLKQRCSFKCCGTEVAVESFE